MKAREVRHFMEMAGTGVNCARRSKVEMQWLEAGRCQKDGSGLMLLEEMRFINPRDFQAAAKAGSFSSNMRSFSVAAGKWGI